MRIPCEPLLDYFRLPGLCEACGYRCPVRRDPDHIFARGAGSGSRLDIPCNIVAIGPAFTCDCHQRKHNENRNPSREDLLAKVAERYTVDVLTVRSEIYRALNQLPKGSTYTCPFTGFRWGNHGEDVFLPSLQEVVRGCRHGAGKPHSRA